jgi:hypothetical protein
MASLSSLIAWSLSPVSWALSPASYFAKAREFFFALFWYSINCCLSTVALAAAVFALLVFLLVVFVLVDCAQLLVQQEVVRSKQAAPETIAQKDIDTALDTLNETGSEKSRDRQLASIEILDQAMSHPPSQSRPSRGVPKTSIQQHEDQQQMKDTLRLLLLNWLIFFAV